MSPLMDPKLDAARNRFKTRKPEANGKPSEFQAKLRKNPYAQAIASPVRSCMLTEARIPAYFLIDFGLARHPKTGKPWQLPKLAIDRNTISPDAKYPDAKSPDAKSPDAKDAGANVHSNLPDVQETSEGSGAYSQPARAVASEYILSQRPALSLVSQINERTFVRMTEARWKTDGRFNCEEIVWRQDMESFVAGLMRKKCVSLLKYLSGQPAAYIAACDSYEGLQKKHQSGAALWLGKQYQHDLSAAEGVAPSPYAMLQYKSSTYIPLYNMPVLLGNECLDQLRGSGTVFQGPLAVIKHKRNTVNLQLLLWKLMGYLSSGADGA
ncbi:MAG: hypothetical protein Q9174_001354 [Haloplaca sp. 1 TL-2023]